MTIRMGSKAEREIFWLDDPANLFTKDTWTRFVPTNEMTVPEALNAVVRFSIYFSFLMSFITGNANYLLFVPVILMLSVVLVKVYPETQILKEAFNNKDHTKFEKPKQSNPFMNVLIPEIKYDPERPEAASVDDPTVKQQLDDMFRTNFFNDPTDVFGKSQDQRQFITMPSTSIPNDRESFMKWCYNITPQNCKSGGREGCLPGTDGGPITSLNQAY